MPHTSGAISSESFRSSQTLICRSWYGNSSSTIYWPDPQKMRRNVIVIRRVFNSLMSRRGQKVWLTGSYKGVKYFWPLISPAIMQIISFLLCFIRTKKTNEKGNRFGGLIVGIYKEFPKLLTHTLSCIAYIVVADGIAMKLSVAMVQVLGCFVFNTRKFKFEI